jgi:DNA-binding response OmpR family regulator
VPEPRSTILLVEVDDNLRRLFAIALTLHGYDSIEARNGVEALAILDRHPFDAVVLDLVLPDIDGASIRQEIAAHPRHGHLPVIIISDSREPLRHLNPACVLRKSVTPGDVVNAVRRCIEQSRNLIR